MSSCCLAGLGEGVCKVKWDRNSWQCGSNSTRAFAAPGTHLFHHRDPVDMVSCWHTVKLDCRKHHHAETDKRKNRRCFYFQILGVTAEEGRNCCANISLFIFILQSLVDSSVLEGRNFAFRCQQCFFLLKLWTKLHWHMIIQYGLIKYGF